MPRPQLTLSILLLLGAALAGGVAPAGQPPSEAGSFYERVAARLASRTDLDQLGRPAPEMTRVAWMRGNWTVEATVFATRAAPESHEKGTSVITAALGGTWLQMADTYPTGTQDLGFLTYNLVTRRWVSQSLDSTGNAVAASAAAWQGDRLEMLARDIEIVGERVTLRQTITRRGADEFLLLNEELRPDGSWLPLDQYRYQRAEAAIPGH